MPSSADLLLDTSAAIALLAPNNPSHQDVRFACKRQVLGLAGHALIETFSVLTRLPGDQRLDAVTASRAISTEFPRSVALSADLALETVSLFAAAGISGGSVYDGLVGLAAKSAAIPLLTCDRRATITYAALHVDIRMV